MKRQLICSKFWNVKNFKEETDKVGTKHSDFIAQGYIPNQGGNGVLYHWDNVPIGYYDVPTLNYMIYSSKLWDDIINNELIRAAMEGNCFWGEADHPDRDEVSLKEVACRVSNMHKVEHNLVLGDLDLMDTPNGLICYSLAKTGRIGNSTRGYGELIPSNFEGVQLVNDADGVYTHVCSDMVALPAVPCANSTIVQAAGLAAGEIGNLEEHLRALVEQAIERNPTARLRMLHGILTKNDAVVNRLAASIDRRNYVVNRLNHKK